MFLFHRQCYSSFLLMLFCFDYVCRAFTSEFLLFPFATYLSIAFYHSQTLFRMFKLFVSFYSLCSTKILCFYAFCTTYFVFVSSCAMNFIRKFSIRSTREKKTHTQSSRNIRTHKKKFDVFLIHFTLLTNKLIENMIWKRHFCQRFKKNCNETEAEKSKTKKDIEKRQRFVHWA